MSSTPVSSSAHIAQLERAYREVGDRTWSTEDLVESNLEVSRNLFTPESLAARSPRPKHLEVFALLSGLPFRVELTSKLTEVQQRISATLGERLHYWVASANLGVEYCVFKWPTDSWNEERLGVVQAVLGSIRQRTFRFTIGGVQVNPDGCVVAKGFDEDGIMFRVREKMAAEIPFLPSRQSRWAHVPLGRILEPLGSEKFRRLAQLMATMAGLRIASTEIGSMKLVHETRWYMEEKTILADYPLASAAREVEV